MKMNQCPNNHYYDSEKSAVCPYCNPETGNGKTTPLYSQFDFNGWNKDAGIISGDGRLHKGSADRKESFVQSDMQINISSPHSDIGADSGATVGYFTRSIGSNPVVGWLVAVGGPYFGEDFRLKAGRNFIGRSPEMDIQLSLDITVSRQKHAIVVYDPKGRLFIAQPGESKHLYYVNDEVVLNNVQLKNYDVLTIGRTQLMLVMLCGEHFNWNEELN